MKPNQASRTARYMAFFRALETNRNPERRLFDDPYAISFLDAPLKILTRLYSLPFSRSLIDKLIQRRIPGALASGIGRTKYIDHLLCRAIKSGVRQVVILGAGFDTRSLRLEFLRDIPVIEIDHPDTATQKIARLKRLGPLPPNTTYLQHDFNHTGSAGLFDRSPIDLGLPTAILWEGVSNYLDPAAIDQLFSQLGRFATGSYLLFTYVDRQMLDHPGFFYKAIKLQEDLAKLQEKWTFGWDPSELPGWLNRYGYSLIEDRGATAYRERYLSERKNILKGYEFYHVAFAGRNAGKDAGKKPF